MQKAALALALTITCAGPLHAQGIETVPAHLNGAGPVSMGSFAGVRVRMPLGGKRGERQVVRAGLTIAPMQHRGGGDLKGPAWRIGDGLEFGFRSDEATPHLSMAGQRLTPAHYSHRGSASSKQRNSLSDFETVAVVAGGLAVVAGVGYLIVGKVAADNSE